MAAQLPPKKSARIHSPGSMMLLTSDSMLRDDITATGVLTVRRCPQGCADTIGGAAKIERATIRTEYIRAIWTIGTAFRYEKTSVEKCRHSKKHIVHIGYQ
jgi:hypothetical protein